MKQPSPNVHADKLHVMPSGRAVIGVSHSWAKEVDRALNSILDASPDLRHVAIQVPKAEGDVRRLFHSADGLTWRQVHLREFGARRFDIAAIVRGAKELDGDPAFYGSLTEANLRLRQIAGDMVAPRDLLGRVLATAPGSLAGWVDARLRPILDHAGVLYVEGATNEKARNGRRLALVTIERLIRHLRCALQPDDVFLPPQDDQFGSMLENAFKTFVIRRHVPFITNAHDMFVIFGKVTAGRRKELAKGVWADAARMPRDARFDTVYGALLRQAEGHPIYGDDDYRRLEALLAADLEAGYRVVRLDGHLFIRSDNRWRPARLAPVSGEASWERGVIVSRNFGRVIVPPFIRDGEIVPGYTRNGPGEGPSEPRSEPVTMRCLDRPLHDANLHWIHAYHAWETARG